jgi:hypothetical protein
MRPDSLCANAFEEFGERIFFQEGGNETSRYRGHLYSQLFRFVKNKDLTPSC